METWESILTSGVSAGAVALMFMFKMYLDRRKNGNGKIVTGVLLADAINKLTLAVKEMHSSHVMQIEVIRLMTDRLTEKQKAE